MSCTVKICYKDWCLVLIHSKTKETEFTNTEFAKSIGYDGNLSAMTLTGLTAEPETKSGAPAKDVPATAQIATEIGVNNKRFTNSFQINYDKSKRAYVWSDSSKIKLWFVETNQKAGSLANSSVTATFEGFDQYADVAAFTIKNNGNTIAHISR